MRWVPIVALLVACGDNRGEYLPPENRTDPSTLLETGLCANARCDAFADDVIELAPNYVLFANGATKRRWLSLPEGTQIDTSNMDDWRFPVGTRLWKEFTRDGVRVETRYMTKLLADDSAPRSWLFVSFAWNGRQNETVLAPNEGVPDANGTPHDIPSRSDCLGCHENLPGRVLGVGAMSLEGASPVGVADLVEMDLLSTPPASAFVVPGTDIDRAAFGYLHANCGHCHNPSSRPHLETPLELRLVTTATTLADVPARATTVDVPAIVGGIAGPIVHPGDPAGSVMIIRMNAPLAPTKMPALGTEMVDPVGQDVLTAWILEPP